MVLLAKDEFMLSSETVDGARFTALTFLCRSFPNAIIKEIISVDLPLSACRGIQVVDSVYEQQMNISASSSNVGGTKEQ